MTITIQDTISQGLIFRSGRDQGLLSNSLLNSATGFHLNQSVNQDIVSDQINNLLKAADITNASPSAASTSAREITDRIRNINLAVRNVNDSISLAQVGQAGLDAVEGQLVEMRELAVLAATTRPTDDERDAMQDSAEDFQQNIKDIAQNTLFDGRQILETTETIPVQSGAETGEVDYVTLSDLVSNLTDIDLSSRETAKTAINVIDQDLTDIRSLRARFATLESGMKGNMTRLSSAIRDISAAGLGFERPDRDDDQPTTIGHTSATIRNSGDVALRAQASLLQEYVLELI